jgi:hypothetical protein
MQKYGKHAVRGLVGLLLLIGATPAAAAGGCWNEKTVAAAKVRDLQTVMMVGALQCRNSEHDVLTHYNKFIKAHRVAITSHNDVLKTHFKTSSHVRDYDKFTTALANSRSVDAADPAFCERTAALARELAAADRAKVEEIAVRTIATPKGVGRTCS